MEIVVLGAGAIGSLYGAKLAAKNDVVLVGNEKHVAAINAKGLCVEGLERSLIHVRAVTEIDSVGPAALVLLTTKVTDTARALAWIRPLLHDDTTVVCLQNGLGSEAIARRMLGDDIVVLRAITQFGAILKGPGVIQFMARGYTILENHERSERIARTLTAGGLDCRISRDITTDVWHKAVVNCVVNPITAILGCEVGGIANPQLESLKTMVIDECVSVAAAQGIRLAGDFRQEIDDVFRPSRNIASMLQDLRRGRPTEIDYMNGAIVAMGQAKGISCPVNAALSAIIKAMELRSLIPEKMLEPQLA